MSSEVKLSIKPYTPSTLPPEQTLVEAGKDVLKSTKSWKPGKTFSNTKGDTPYHVKTSSRPREQGEEAGWHSRYSEHTEGTFDEFWERLGRNKAMNEKEYIPEIKKATLLRTISPTQSIWTLYYKLTPPVSNRVFTVLQTVHLEGGANGTPREGWIISIPVDVSEDSEMKAKEEKSVKGRYCSVELIKETKDGLVEWSMATSSTPGGMIPQYFTEKSIPSQIYKDVPHFVHWLKQLKAAEPVESAVEQAVNESPAAPSAEVVPPAEQASEVATQTIDGKGQPVPTVMETAPV